MGDIKWWPGIRRTVGALIFEVVAVVPNGVEMCIFWVLREGYYYGIVLCNKLFALYLLLLVYGVSHTGNITLPVSVGQRGALCTDTCHGWCQSRTVGVRCRCIRIVGLLQVNVRILFCTGL